MTCDQHSRLLAAMVNPSSINSLLTADLSILPPSSAHRAYSQPDEVEHESDTDVSMHKGSGSFPSTDKTDEFSVVTDKLDDGTVVADDESTEEDRDRVMKISKTASWIATFFLITTDVLGPGVAPWAFSVLGFVPGAIIFFFLGIIATYTGLILLNLFIKLDTPEQPIRCFSDIAERIAAHWGPRTAVVIKNVVAVLQAIQLLMSVAVLIFGEAIVLSQLVNFKICFVQCLVIFTVIGNTAGFIKSFKNLGYFANLSVWLNLTVCFFCLGVAQTSGVLDPAGSGQILATAAEARASASAFTNQPFAYMAVAVSNIIYAYGGATMYVELMSEMRNPRDFWKSLFCAEFIIVGMYFFFGIYFYASVGVYTQPVFQSTLSNVPAQQAANIISLFSAMVACVMYGNVGLKVIYYQIVVDMLKGPQLTTKKGTILWSVMVVAYWWIAFLIAGCVPNIQSIVGIVGALCIMQFSYTFPPLMQFFFYWSQGTTLREKLTDKWGLKLFDMTIAIASMAACGIGLWGSILSMIAATAAGNATGFSCVNPQYGI